MDYKKILQNLAYRLKVTSKDDPEYNNALRLYERLKEKYHVTDEELLDKKLREFTDKRKFIQILIQLFVRRLHGRLDGKDSFCFKSYYFKDQRKNKSLFNFEIYLDDDEYKFINENFNALKKLYERELCKLEKRQKNELKELEAAHDRELKAFRYAFLDKADLLSPPDGEETNTEPAFTLSDVIKAAQGLDDIIFPKNMINQPPVKQIEAK